MRCLTIIVLAGWCGLGLMACSSGEKGPKEVRVDRTGSRTVEVLWRPEPEVASLYRVDQYGDLGYGGGLKAMSGTTTWTVPLTDDEIAQVFAIIDEHGWQDAKPKVETASDVRYDVLLTEGNRRRRFTLKGETPGIVPLRELLDTAARRRLDRELETLPRPSAA